MNSILKRNRQLKFFLANVLRLNDKRHWSSLHEPPTCFFRLTTRVPSPRLNRSNKQPSTFGIMKTQCSNLVQFVSVPGLAVRTGGCRDRWRGSASFSAVLVAAVTLLSEAAHGDSVEVGSPSPLIGPVLYKTGTDYGTSHAPFETSADLAHPGNGAQPAVALDTIPGISLIHQPGFANDGYYGNGDSWIGNSGWSWLKIDLGDLRVVERIAFGRDRLGNGQGYDDRDPGQFTISFALTDNIYANGDDSGDSAEYVTEIDSSVLAFSGEVRGPETLQVILEPPIIARFLKLRFESFGAAIDEVEVYGQAVLGPGSWVYLPGRELSISEGHSTISLPVTVVRDSTGPEVVVTVDYATVNETARSGEDYVAASGTLRFAAGETKKQIPISILNDALKESDEQFRLELSNPTGGVSLGNSNVVIRIQDNDPGVRFMTETVNVSEAAGFATIGVQRGDDLNIPFTVDYATVAGTAHVGEDFVAASGTLQFAAGETNKQVAITILADALREPWEQFALVLSNPTGGVSLGNSNVVIWIQNNVPTTYYVNVKNPNPMFPYTSWATAATNIQHAVDAAKAGDTVLVTNGVYAVGGKTNEWSGVESRVTITTAIRLESVNGPLVTTIEGGIVSEWEAPVRCVYLGTNAVLSGFTLTNGAGASRGAGVFSEPSGIVTNCVITGNHAGNFTASGHGGGAYGGNLYNCTLMNNTAKFGRKFDSGDGGGASGSILYNCTLSGNSSGYGGGAIWSALYNCTLTGNSGGGAFGSILYNCTLSGNSSGYAGGASWSTLYNCTVTGNSGGGVIDCTLFNCTVTGNDGGGVGVYWLEPGSTLHNSIVYYNYGGNYANGTTLNYCCTTPLPTNGVGNITGHPLFMDMAAGDFRLREESPCIDVGTNLLGMMTFTYWTGTYNPDTGEPIMAGGQITDPTDMLGNTRFIDGNFDGTVAWDMGAYEFNSFNPPQFTCAPQRMPDCWRLSITGAPNKWVHVQRSSDLKNWEDFFWPSYIFMGSAGVKQVDDADLSQKAMFYRAVVE